VFALAPAPAPAQSQDCSMITNQDQRAVCRALTSGRDSGCSLVRDGDQRAYCRGLVTGDSSRCSIIRDANARPMRIGARPRRLPQSSPWRIATRYDKLAASYLAFVQLAAIRM
jgi:hypothetical protein